MMQRPYFLLSIFVVAALLTGCATSAIAQSRETQAVENAASTGLPEQSALIQTVTPEVVPQDPPANCPVTVPQTPPFIPPSPYDSLGFKDEFWYGSNSLWTALRQDGVWRALPHNPEGYTQKVFWWRDGYIWNEEPQPELIVTGKRLDASAPPLIVSRATNAYASDIGSAMLVGVDFPTLGCWKITGQYQAAELSFVVWVAP